MTKQSVFQSAWMPGVFLVLAAAHANAATIISYTTNDPGTEFVGGVNSLTLNDSSGVAATLVFSPNTVSGTGVPSNINFGSFLLSCATCTNVQNTVFGAFTFDLIISDSTDGATGEFVGTSSGGTVSLNSSNIQVNWQAPYMIGPGTVNALTGNFGTTTFDMVSPTTLITAPNSGSTPGTSTVSGQVTSTTPEPATFALIGAALFALGLLGRKKAPRQ